VRQQRDIEIECCKSALASISVIPLSRANLDDAISGFASTSVCALQRQFSIWCGARTAIIAPHYLSIGNTIALTSVIAARPPCGALARPIRASAPAVPCSTLAPRLHRRESIIDELRLKLLQLVKIQRKII
jgi:hypothetical protein